MPVRLFAGRRSASWWSMPRLRRSSSKVGAPGEAFTAAKARAVSAPVSRLLWTYRAATIFFPPDARLSGDVVLAGLAAAVAVWVVAESAERPGAGEDGLAGLHRPGRSSFCIVSGRHSTE
jgi:hypothetical protein